jgi:hypothetical protein
MKKLYLILIAFSTNYSFAQTIIQSDLPFAGLGWTSGSDTNYNAPVLPGGSGQSWDYSGLQYDFVDTSGFGAAAGTPYAASFPSANLAALDMSTGDWTYFTNSSTGFYVNGFVTGTVPFVISPPQMYVPVPFSYGNTVTNISRVVIDTVFTTYPAKVILNFHADFEADGSGSLITPTATYPSTLRVKEILLETDSLMVDFLSNGNYTLLGAQQHQTTNYRWYTHGNTANYILGITADSLGITAVQSDYLMQWAMLGTNDFNVSTALKVYPSPATDYITISNGTSSIQSLEIFNLLGEKVIFSESSINTQRSELKLDVSDWVPGIYTYTILTGSIILQGKFSVQH